MPITVIHTDIFDTTARFIAVPVAANGRFAINPLFTALGDHFPAFLSDCRKRAKVGLLELGTYWLWRSTTPALAGMVIRETPQGAARPRYVEAAFGKLRENWQLEGIDSLAIAPLANSADLPALRLIIENIFRANDLPVFIHETTQD